MLPVVPDLPPADLVGPRWIDEGRLGRGAMGEVRRVRDRWLGRVVARKTMEPGLAGDPVAVARFRAEVAITAQLDHPNVVQVFGLDGDGAYTMKRVVGRTFADMLETAAAQSRAGPVSRDHDLVARLEAFLGVCDALAFAHARGVVHRDLKPENLMIGPDGSITVMDWGIAKRIGTADAVGRATLGGAGANLTQLGTAIGTPAYMSPEQARGKNDEIDGRSDQYALGLILSEAVTLTPALSGPDVGAVMARAAVGNRDPMRNRRGRPAPPAGLVAIVDRACQRRPADRYPDVDALAEDLRRWLRDEPVVARLDGPLGRAARWIARHRRAAVVGVLLLAIGVGATGTLGVVGAGAAVLTVEARQQARQEALAAALGKIAARAHRVDVRLAAAEGTLDEAAAVAASWKRAPSIDLGAALGRAARRADRHAASPAARPALPWVGVQFTDGAAFGWPSARTLPPADTDLDTRGAWGAPARGGAGAVVAVSRALYDDEGHRMGAVAAEVDLGAALGDALADAADHLWLLDPAGRVVADATGPLPGRADRADLVATLGASRAGGVETATGHVLWQRLQTVPWTLVFEGPADPTHWRLR